MGKGTAGPTRRTCHRELELDFVWHNSFMRERLVGPQGSGTGDYEYP
jgi:hypothetical protein